MWTRRRTEAVTIADADAGELLRLVVLGLRVKAQRTGAVASVRLVDLLRQMHAADLRHASGAVDVAASAIASGPDSPSIMDGEWVTVSDAAGAMGCSATWIRWLARAGKLTSRRIGQRTLLIDRRSLDAYRHRERPA